MKKPHPQDSKLLQSLRVLSTILKDEGSPLETHVLLKNGWAIAQTKDGIIGIGEPIAEDLLACPHGLLLKEALAKCGQAFSLTQLPHNLSLQAGKFKALIPCLPIENIQSAFPDPIIADINDNFKISLSVVAPLVLDEENVVALSILVDKGTITATDKKIMIQHWHGIDLPPKLVIPKVLIQPLIKNSKSLKGFGFSKSSCTFHYEDGSWIKSQYFATEWPDVSMILDKKTNPHSIPEDFYNAIDALEPFSEDKVVYCNSNIMRSHSEEGKGASYDVYGLPAGPILNIKQIKIIRPYIKTVDFLVPHHNHKMMLFYGDNIRGAVAGRV